MSTGKVLPRSQMCGGGRWERKKPIAAFSLEGWQLEALRNTANETGRPVSAVLRAILAENLQPQGVKGVDAHPLRA